MINPDFSYRKKYWAFLTKYVKTFYGSKMINEPYWVEKILINIFQILGYNIRVLIKKETRAAFYLHVNLYHENSIALWLEIIKNNKNLALFKEFPIVRRIFVSSNLQSSNFRKSKSSKIGKSRSPV